MFKARLNQYFMETLLHNYFKNQQQFYRVFFQELSYFLELSQKKKVRLRGNEYNDHPDMVFTLD